MSHNMKEMKGGRGRTKERWYRKRAELGGRKEASGGGERKERERKKMKGETEERKKRWRRKGEGRVCSSNTKERLLKKTWRKKGSEKGKRVRREQSWKGGREDEGEEKGGRVLLEEIKDRGSAGEGRKESVCCASL